MWSACFRYVVSMFSVCGRHCFRYVVGMFSVCGRYVSVMWSARDRLVFGLWLSCAQTVFGALVFGLWLIRSTWPADLPSRQVNKR